MNKFKRTIINIQFALVLMWGVASPAFGDQSSILRARAAAAIAIHNAADKIDSPVPPTVIKAMPQPGKRSFVTMYTATWCAPCQRAKADLKVAKLPFELQFQDVSNGGQPDWCESIPAFSWMANGQTRYVLGFPGVPQLIDSWERTLKK